MNNSYVSVELLTGNLRPKIVAPPPSYNPSEKAINFILIKVTPGSIKKTMMYLKKIKDISGLHPVFGEYDLVLIVREKNKSERQKLIKRLWQLQSVVDVHTLLAAS
jgi:DNA-binding Lrp family transcriptional regulator